MPVFLQSIRAAFLLLPLPGSLLWLWVVHNYRVMSGQVLRKHVFKLKDLFFNGVP